MTCRLRFLRRHRAWLVSVLVLVLVMMAVLDSQTRGYSHLRDILTAHVHYLQPLHLLPPERSNLSIGEKYDGEDELTEVLTRRLTEFSADREDLQTPLCTDPTIKVDEACYDSTCRGTFSPSPRDRLRQVLASRRQIPARYLQAMASATARVTGHKYLLVSALSSNHYYEMQGLIHSARRHVFPHLTNYTFVLFDLGLTAFERFVTEKNCQCTVLDFPFSELPEFVRHLTCYSWKTIVIASLLDKAEYLVWTDASIRWESRCPLESLFERCRQRGFQSINDYGSIAVRTVQSLFDFHGDQQCQYAPFSEMLSGFEMIYNDRFTREAVIRPWLSCALDQRCMCVRDHVWQLRCPSTPPRGYGRCHRYDQSGLGVIQSKLLLAQRPIVYLPRGCVRVAREVKMNWFEPRKADVQVLVAVLFVVVNVVTWGVVFAFCRWSEGGGRGGRGGGGGSRYAGRGGGGGGGRSSGRGGKGEFKDDSVRWWRVTVMLVGVEGVVVLFLLWVFV